VGPNVNAADRSEAVWRKRATPRRRHFVLLVMLAAIAESVAACGGGVSPGVGSAGSLRTTTNSGAAQSGLRYTSCMRAHGVPNFPDPASNGLFQLPKGLKHEPQFPSAFSACARDLPGGRPLAKQVNVREELGFANCMRAHGISDFPDPDSSGRFSIIPADTNSPRFAAAARACQVTGIHWNGP
jgi:hypothetical protein